MLSRAFVQPPAMDSLEAKRLTATDDLRPLSPGWDLHEAQGRNTELPAYGSHAILCLTLHVLLILFHVAILIVQSGHYEHAVSFTVTSVALQWYPLIATTVMQVFGTVSHTCTILSAIVAHGLTDIPRRPRRLHADFGIPQRALRQPDADRPARQE